MRNPLTVTLSYSASCLKSTASILLSGSLRPYSSTPARMPSNTVNILADATNTFRNGLRRMTNGQPRDRPRPKGKENTMPGQANSPDMAQGDSRWDPVDGTIVIKVSVPTTEDIWRFRVPENITLRAFRTRVELKIGFAVTFAEGPSVHSRRITSEDIFRRWVMNRVKDGRNRPLIAFRKQYLPLPTPSTPVSPLLPSPDFSPSTPISPVLIHQQNQYW